MADELEIDSGDAPHKQICSSFLKEDTAGLKVGNCMRVLMQEEEQKYSTTRKSAGET
jgi:hypothetical protein